MENKMTERLIELRKRTTAERAKFFEEKCLELQIENAELRRFKTYVHKRLDEAGVYPYRHVKCRIMRRLDDLLVHKRVRHDNYTGVLLT